MSIAATNTAASVDPLHRVDQGFANTPSPTTKQNLQNVFSAVLAEVNRVGYQSAEPLASTTSLQDEVGLSWDQWFQEASLSRYRFVAGAENPSVQANKSAEDLRTDYKAILIDAYQNGGYATPQSYLRSKSIDELRTIQQVQHLAEPIQVESLSEEAALNLLVPPDAQVDLNKDGLTAVGAGKKLQFPSSNTPASVRDAWDAAVEGLSEADRMVFELRIASQTILANIHVDESGRFVRSSEPGDADWVNPLAASSFSYVENASDWLDYLEHFKPQIPAEQYQRDFQFWSTFRTHLIQNDAR